MYIYIYIYKYIYIYIHIYIYVHNRLYCLKTNGIKNKIKDKTVVKRINSEIPYSKTLSYQEN